MGRPRKFCRDDVLERALPLFWSRGFAYTGVQELEKTTGVNKSGLYSEFEGKEEIFVESLRHYLDSRPPAAALEAHPPGWNNIEQLFKDVSISCSADQKGCFVVNSLRELPHLPHAAQELVAAHRARLRQSILRNVAAEKTRLGAEAVTEFVATLFAGFCIELHMKSSRASLQRRIEELMQVLKAL